MSIELNLNNSLFASSNNTQSNDIKIHEGEEANGKIDADFKQGFGFGDCALLTSIFSLAQTDEGSQAIEDAMNILRDENGDITGYEVTFDTIGETYYISQDELIDAKTYKVDGKSQTYYSYGDDDVTVLELAFEKCFEESQDEQLRYLVDNYTTRKEGVSMLRGVNPASVTYLLLGDSADWYKSAKEASLSQTFVSHNDYITTDIEGNEVKINNGSYYKLTLAENKTAINVYDAMSDTTYCISGKNFKNDILYPDSAKTNTETRELFNNFNKDNGDVLVFATTTKNAVSVAQSSGGETLAISVKDSEGKDVTLYAPHAYSVLDVNNDTGIVTLINPHDTSKPLEVTLDSLMELDSFYAYSLLGNREEN